MSGFGASILLVFAFVCVCSPAEAKLAKYYYLKQGNSVLAFKSKAACEAYRRPIVAQLRKVEKRTGIKNDYGMRCIETLPYGYRRPYPS